MTYDVKKADHTLKAHIANINKQCPRSVSPPHTRDAISWNAAGRSLFCRAARFSVPPEKSALPR